MSKRGPTRRVAAERATEHHPLILQGKVQRRRVVLTHCECGGGVEFGTDSIGRSLQRCNKCGANWPLWARESE